MITSNNLSKKGLFIWVICAIFFTYEFMLRTVLGTFENALTHDLHLSLVTFAILSSSVYQFIYGAMQIPVGIIVDKFGLKKSLVLALICCTFSVLGFGMAEQFSTAFIFRFAMGFGSSFGFIGLLVAVYEWLPRSKIGLFIGLSQLIGTLGPMVAAGPLNALADSDYDITWRAIFFGLAFFGLILTVLIFFFVENNKSKNNSFQLLKRPMSIQQTLSKLIFQPQVWYIAIYSACIYFTIEYLSENSGKAFLMLQGYSSQSASNLITLSWLGYALGCPLLGYVSDLIERRKSILMLASFIGLTSGIFIVYFSTSPLLLALGFFFLGVGASGQSVGIAMIAEQCGENYLAAGLGFNNAIVVLLCSTNAPLIASVLNYLSPSHDALSVTHYQQAFGMFLFLILLAVFLSVFFIKETFCKSNKETKKLSY